MPKLTPAQLDEAAERWFQHVERLLQKRNRARAIAEIDRFIEQQTENELKLEQMRAARVIGRKRA